MQPTLARAPDAPVRTLPTVNEFVAGLNALQKAREEKDVLEAGHIDLRLRGMIPLGLYSGHLEETGTRVSTCRVQTVQRRGNSADLHAYYLEVQELQDGSPVGPIVRIEVVDFLKEVRRQGVCERQYVGQRFRPV